MEFAGDISTVDRIQKISRWRSRLIHEAINGAPFQKHVR